MLLLIKRLAQFSMENVQGQISSLHTLLSKLSELHGSDFLSREERSIASQARITITSLYNPIVRRNIDYFLLELERPPSAIKHKFAMIVRQNDAFKQNSFNKLARIFDTLETSSINQIVAALNQSPQSYALVNGYVKEAQAAFGLYKEFFAEIAELFPKQHPRYPDYIKIHAFNQQELPFLQREIEHAFEITVNHMVFHKKKEKPTEW